MILRHCRTMPSGYATPACAWPWMTSVPAWPASRRWPGWRRISSRLTAASWSRSTAGPTRRPSSMHSRTSPGTCASASSPRVSKLWKNSRPSWTQTCPGARASFSVSPGLRGQGPLPFLTQLQRTEGQDRADDGGDPHADDHLGFLQSTQFEVVVEGGHAKDALAAAQLETAHLKDDASGFHHEEPARDDQQQLLLDDHSHGAQRSAQPQ